MSAPIKIGVLGGSGLYELEGFTNAQEVPLSTPFGDPSDAYVAGELDGTPLVFLPRHGRGHRLNPSEINYRANIWGMKALGVTHIVSVSAVGSMRDEIVPGEFVVIDQFVDRTRHVSTHCAVLGQLGHRAGPLQCCAVLWELSGLHHLLDRGHLPVGPVGEGLACGMGVRE